ncbi:MAG: phenylalanine--tRNA ligase beta subunit-related protein, partial [Candidatus Dependentiae bacterium]
MKISLRWLCDHLDTEWRSINVDLLVELFNTKVAEIEQVDTVSHAVSEWSLKSDGVIVHTATQQPVSYRDVGVDKEGTLPPVHVTGADDQLAAQWEADDVILEVDNKSVTHRPDMWGHRGFAREIAALLAIPFKDKAAFLADVPVEYNQNGVAHDGSFTLQNDDPTRCKTLTGLHVPQLAMQETDIKMLSRFVKIGYRGINATVDLTNYVMADWGQPMHAYDANRLSGNLLRARRAKEGETLALLDDSECELTAEDTIVADSEKTLGLAGIMGGRDDSINDNTTHVLLEAACWHASSTRRSAARHKVRTESSQRFEKTLDPAMTVESLQRYMGLVAELGIAHTSKGVIWATGEQTIAPTLTMTHQRIERDLGITISVDIVRDILKKLSFGVDTVAASGDTTYTITIPTFRASKDVTAVHDIVEEIARSYGFDRITPELPLLHKEPTDFEPVHRVR